MRWSAVPTGKLGHSDTKVQTANLDGVIIIKNARRLIATVERNFLKIAQNLSCWKVFGATFFQKGSAVPTTKLGHSGIKFQAAYPDGVELTTVERSFLKTPKNLSARKFFAELFFKKAT